MPKIRLDQLIVSRGLAETRSKAQALLLAGSVRVNGQPAGKAGTMVDDAVALEVTAALPYASRGGHKLAHALDAFGLSPAGLTALDAGASTGGFTDVLLQRGAARVYAVDVGYGILDYRLRADPRVVVLERTNIRHLESLPGVGSGESEAGQPNPQLPTPSPRAECATIDVSFISLKLVLPAVQRLIAPDAWVVPLIKPQFEAGPGQVGKGGVVRDPDVHRAVLRDVLAAAVALGLTPRGLARSPLLGPAGNVEFLAWLQPGGAPIDIEAAIRAR
ncbi:TlyA family RNA methyltransferase [Oscillochloris sp. ZM17-4]|uniref:TlyA family RNA methyltransferase n=1 Tax=Oscillochloris sp. ZM17-4 TaxID=2866714 RepID=UPI001C731D74|nr:TlyA family RNA methyltransferase [Oscillochloris sp. ZM17-4]MBX0329166.1 TlyA family RNA methyltransferase [Oscillochloris sp. ZM17-4]